MSSEEELSNPPSVASNRSFLEEIEVLKSKFLSILEDRFFGNLKHDWRRQLDKPDDDQQQQKESLPSFHSLSDESGSYLVLDGKKVSFEWFRMALARSSSHEGDEAEEPETEAVAIPSTTKANKDNPFAVGTAFEMAAWTQPADRFHTHRSRARTGMRERFLVEEPPFEEETLGFERKYPSRLATQRDPHYRSDISYRPRMRNFMRVDAIHRLRDSSRKQFETYYRKEYLFERTEVHKAEQRHHRELNERCEEIVEAMRKIRFQRFSQSMRVLDMVKPCFEETTRLEKELRVRERALEALWNRVVQLENDWVQRIRYQNFLYLIMPKDWREENDWIHMDEEGKLEEYARSIANRNTANIRSLDEKNDIWAVKEFFEQEYVEKTKPVHTVYEDSASLLKGVAELDVNSMSLLSRLNTLNWMKTDAEKKTQDVQSQAKRVIRNLQYSIQDLLQKEVNYKKRSICLKQIFDELVQNPLRASLENVTTRTLETLLFVLYKQMLPPEQRENALKFSGTECFMYVFDLMTQQLAEFDKIRPDLLHAVEKRVRFLRTRELKAAERAAEEDRRHHLLGVQMKRSLAPRYVRPPRTGKLPRSRLKKKSTPEVVPPPTQTKLDKIFELGFGEGATMTTVERKNLELDLAYQNYSSVRFEHFLRTLGYEPDYDFVSMVEQRDGPETNFFRNKDLIPVVLKRMKKWDELQEKFKRRLLQRVSETFSEQ